MKHPKGIKPPSPECAALFEAVRRGSLRDVGTWLAKGVEANIRDPLTGNTPLRLAAGLNHLSIAKALLEAGADPNVGNALESMPLHLAVSPLQDRDGESHPPNLKLARLLLSFGADPDMRDAEGKKAIDLAADPAQFSTILAERLSKRLPATRAPSSTLERL